MITVIVFSFERFFVLRKASGAGNLDNFVVKVRSLLNQNRVDEALEECDRQQGSVAVSYTHLDVYKRQIFTN